MQRVIHVINFQHRFFICIGFTATNGRMTVNELEGYESVLGLFYGTITSI
jgi:hypothetical protein